MNNIAYALATAQAIYMPNFQGYINLAQRNVIEKNLNKKVWGYWRWEQLWGHLSTTYDPVDRDNIMLTGYIGLQVCLYMGATGDMRYSEAGSLTFAWGNRRFAHDIHSVIRSLDENYSAEKAFCLYPCEPGWIYTPCNFMGLMTLIAYDRVFSTDYVGKHKETFLRKLDQEFTLANGDLVALRSQSTGMAVPFPFGNEGQTLFINAIAPERARQAWAAARQDLIIEKPDGGLEILGLAKGVDFGRYKPSPIGHLYGLLGSAGEMGDLAVFNEVLRLLEEIGKPKRDGGVLTYDCSSTMMTTMVRSCC
jgi:hypothetical protein